MKPRALISVFNKSGAAEFAAGLLEQGYEIVSTGATAKLLTERGLTVTAVETVTGFPECLDGRVKTLHPYIHGGILALRDSEPHMAVLNSYGIAPIDIVAVNLYPFGEVIADPEHTLERAIENIDIGGPAMIRAAAKNYPFVTVITDAGDYAEVLARLKNNALDESFRFGLALKAFSHTAMYDANIAAYLNRIAGREHPDVLTLTFEKKQDLRYGENPHQHAAYYRMMLSGVSGLEQAVFLHGKELSYNNINDAHGAVNLAREFGEAVCVAVKHATPCGVGIGGTVLEAFEKAYGADSVSIFGGIVCFNRDVDLETARKLSDLFLEVIIAPGYTEEALKCLTVKKGVRILVMAGLNERNTANIELKSVGGGLLLQNSDDSDINAEQLTVVTRRHPTDAEQRDMLFAMKVVKHVKSNAIVLAKDGQTVGIGGGAVSRIGAAGTAFANAGAKAEGAVMASDAYFPFPDVAEECARRGVTAIIQPGGSKNDRLSIEQCDSCGIAMIFTGVRHFRH
ncbi:MAG: bifunctional phosphoribosylaminoimidazolecarboxamide formyltransferase/IMP cyclohydrolase [Clostridiales bacterium]|jgi:phosphoribosylaminoimidazolecarboxamide formyltransferase/IMP cyclohydrolase|nr:bifunctional phosphoribosylaminoimidazolecarboxamide formyltransferase/IMP cyclohydrolase [Clostridiales bacterium]